MDIFCPNCKSKTNELIECEICNTIGCPKCIRKKYGKWVCHKCPEPEYKEPDYYNQPGEEKVQSAFASMFG